MNHNCAPVIPPPSTYRGTVRRGIGLNEMTLTEGFWKQLQQVNSESTLQHCLEWMEKLQWIDNFDRVATGTTTGDSHNGWQFADSEIYKLIEALAWEYGRTGQSWTNEALENLVKRVGAAQDADGYLNTCYGHNGQAGRYSDMSSGHELYCIGHLLQAAVARARTVLDPHEDKLVNIAIRAAEHVCREFGAGKRETSSKSPKLCGHPEIEVALAEFARVLDEPRYTEQSRLFIARRGHGTLSPVALLDDSYFQDDIPVRETLVWRGHAVRALYLAAGAVDIAVDTDDDDLLYAVGQQWDRTVERRTYLTGGMGSRHQDEGFGEDWELPPDRAYCETCAGIASVMVSWRLYLATGEVRYADLMERTFYNVIATSPGTDGQSFFYANPLHQRTVAADVRSGEVNPRAEGGVRAPWFDVSCCPTNLARTLASWQTYAASVEGDSISLLQYATGDLTVNLTIGETAVGDTVSAGTVATDTVVLRLTTDYPSAGTVQVEVIRAPERLVELKFRIPHWAQGATLSDHNGTRDVEPGWAPIQQILTPGDVFTLNLPVAPRFTWPDHRIDAVRGCVAVEAGPLVLCLESVDLPSDWPIEDIYVDATHQPISTSAESGANTAIGAVVQTMNIHTGSNPPGIPGYFSHPPTEEPLTAPHAPTLRELKLIPYYQWARRGNSAMRVFLPVAQR